MDKISSCGNPMKPFLIIKAGSTFSETIPNTGDFEDWIRRGMGLPTEQILLVPIHEDQPLPEPATVCAVVITGSHAMVTDQSPWIRQTLHWLQGAVASGLPILGICFGHQLLAEALGGRADWNRFGREIGTVEVTLTPEGCQDPLLGNLPKHFPAQVTHRQSAVTLPVDAVLLATSTLDPHLSFRYGPSCWGVQFHPEFAAEDVRYYIGRLHQQLEAEGLDPLQLLSAVEPTPDASSILSRFAEFFKATA